MAASFGRGGPRTARERTAERFPNATFAALDVPRYIPLLYVPIGLTYGWPGAPSRIHRPAVAPRRRATLPPPRSAGPSRSLSSGLDKSGAELLDSRRVPPP